MGNGSVSHLPESVGGESRTASPGAIKDQAPFRVELGAVLGALGVGPELEHHAGGPHSVGDRALGAKLILFSEVDQYGSIAEFNGHLGRLQVLYSTFSAGDHRLRGLLHPHLLQSEGPRVAMASGDLLWIHW
jgi:hypothetical protein